MRFLPFYAGTQLLAIESDLDSPEAIAAALSRPQSALVLATCAASVLALGAITVAIGLGAGVLFRFADAAAIQLLDPELYVRAVLGARGGGGG